MNKFGLLNIDIILDSKVFDISTFIKDYPFLEEFNDGIFSNAFLYDKREKLKSIQDIDSSLNIIYIIEYRIHGNNFFITFYKDYVSISFSKYLYIDLYTPLIPILVKYGLISDFILVGFETTLFIDEYPNCVDSLIADKSLYPLYVNKEKHKDHLLFKCHKGDTSMEELIEKLLSEIFNNQIKIIN